MVAVFIFNVFFFSMCPFFFLLAVYCLSAIMNVIMVFRVGSFVRNLRSLKIRIGNSIDVNVELYSMTLCKRRENQLTYFIVIAQVCFGNVYKFLNYRLVLMGKTL